MIYKDMFEITDIDKILEVAGLLVSAGGLFVSIYAVRAQFVELKTKIIALEKENERKSRKPKRSRKAKKRRR